MSVQVACCDRAYSSKSRPDSYPLASGHFIRYPKFYAVIYTSPPPAL